MIDSEYLPWLAFAMVSSLALVVALLWTGRKGRLDSRLHELSGKTGSSPEIDSVAELARQTLPRVGAPLMCSGRTSPSTAVCGQG